MGTEISNFEENLREISVFYYFIKVRLINYHNKNNLNNNNNEINNINNNNNNNINENFNSNNHNNNNENNYEKNYNLNLNEDNNNENNKFYKIIDNNLNKNENNSENNYLNNKNENKIANNKNNNENNNLNNINNENKKEEEEEEEEESEEKKEEGEEEGEVFLVCVELNLWTLISNMAIAINSSSLFIKIKIKNSFYILPKDKLNFFISIFNNKNNLNNENKNNKNNVNNNKNENNYLNNNNNNLNKNNLNNNNNIKDENNKNEKQKEKKEEEEGGERYEEIDTFMGSTLLGIKYEPIFFNSFSSIQDENLYKIVNNPLIGNNITENRNNNFDDYFDEISFFNPFFSQSVEKFNFIFQFNFNEENQIDKNGNFKENFLDLKGKNILDQIVNEKLIQKLIVNGKLIGKKGPFYKSFFFCPYSNTKLVNYFDHSSDDHFYVNLKKLSKKLIEKFDRKINQIFPLNSKLNEKFSKFIKEKKNDWLISRRNLKKGIPFPIWENKTKNEIKIIKTIGQLEKLIGRKIKSKKEFFWPMIKKINIPSKKGNGMLKINSSVDSSSTNLFFDRSFERSLFIFILPFLDNSFDHFFHFNINFNNNKEENNDNNLIENNLINKNNNEEDKQNLNNLIYNNNNNNNRTGDLNLEIENNLINNKKNFEDENKNNNLINNNENNLKDKNNLINNKNKITKKGKGIIIEGMNEMKNFIYPLSVFSFYFSKKRNFPFKKIFLNGLFLINQKNSKFHSNDRNFDQSIDLIKKFGYDPFRILLLNSNSIDHFLFDRKKNSDRNWISKSFFDPIWFCFSSLIKKISFYEENFGEKFEPIIFSSSLFKFISNFDFNNQNNNLNFNNEKNNNLNNKINNKNNNNNNNNEQMNNNITDEINNNNNNNKLNNNFNLINYNEDEINTNDDKINNNLSNNNNNLNKQINDNNNNNNNNNNNKEEIFKITENYKNNNLNNNNYKKIKEKKKQK